MNWPLPQDFNEAVQNPSSAFSDPDLKAGQPVVGPTGLPLPRSGNFADVYQIRTPDGRDWAIKCFTRPVTGLDHRYAKVEEALDKAGLPFTIGFTFLGQGVKVRGQWFPAVKMEWVDGLQLNQVVRDQAGNPKALDALCLMWSRLCKRLRDAGIAHADLQHGNILLVPGSRPGSYGLRLIDYDGMYVPALANKPSGELGHANFQHPARAARQIYSPDLDRFPHLVIATALKGLSVAGPSLWERYDNGDNLLFTEDDFREPSQSKLMKELWLTGHPGVQSLVGNLAIACGKPLPQTPWLDQLAPDGIAVPLSAEQAKSAEAALGFAPAAQPAIPVVVAPAAVAAAADPLAFDTPPAPTAPTGSRKARPSGTRPAGTRRREAEPAKKSPLLPVALAAGILLLLGGGIAVAVLMSGGNKPVETVEAPPPEEPRTPKPGPPKDNPTPTPPDTDPQPPDNPDPVPPEHPIVPPQTPGMPPVVVSVSSRTLEMDAAPTLNQRWVVKTVSFPQAVRFSPDGEWVVARMSGIGDLRVHAARNATRVPGFAGEGTRPIADFTPIANGTVVSHQDGEPFAVVWDIKTGKSISKIPVGRVPESKYRPVFQASPDGQYVIVGHAINTSSTNREEQTTRVYETKSGKAVLTLNVWDPRFVFAPDGRLLVADTNRLRWFKLPEGTLDSDIPIPSISTSRVLDCSEDGTLVLHFPSAQRILLLDTGTGKADLELRGRFQHIAGAISPDKRLLALGLFSEPGAGRNAYLVILDLASRRSVGRFLLDSNAIIDVKSITFAPDNSAVALARSGSRQIQVVDLPRELLAVGRPAPKLPPASPGSPMSASPGPARAVVPDDAALKDAEANIRGILKAEYAKRQPAERKALAQKLLKLAGETANDPAARFVMLRDAREFASEGQDPELALQAAEETARHYDVDGTRLKIASLEKITGSTVNNTVLLGIVELAHLNADDAAALDDYELAMKYTQVAVTAARRGKLSAGGVLVNAEARVAQVRKAAEAFQKVKEALARLETARDDADASLAVGRFRCFVQANWDEGLKYLARGNDSALKALAEQDLAAPRNTGDIKLGDAWWDHSRKAPEAEKRACEARARYWYGSALPGLAGLDKVRVEERLGFKIGAIDYRPGLLTQFSARNSAVLKGNKGRVSPTVDYSGREFFDGKTFSEVTVHWNGVIVAPRPGRYRLIAKTDRKVRVRVNGNFVLDTFNKRDRGNPEATVILPDRATRLEIEFVAFNVPEYSLKLFWVAPGKDTEELIPREVFFHDRKTESVLNK